MKTFLGVVGVFSWILAGIMCYKGTMVFLGSTSMMQHNIGMDYIMYSGVLLLAGLVGLGFSIENK